MLPEELPGLCERTAAMDPWKTLQLTTQWLLDDLQTPGLAFDVAEITDPEGQPQIAGWITHAPQGAMEHFRRKNLADPIQQLVGPGDGTYIRDLAVFPGWQGRGVGRALMGRAEVATRELGHLRVFLSVSSFNDQARRFYLQLGFRPVLELPGVLHPQYSETILLRELTP